MNDLPLFVLDVIVKATVLLAIALLVSSLLRSKPAAIRHRVWCLAFCGLLGLPLAFNRITGMVTADSATSRRRLGADC